MSLIVTIGWLVNSLGEAEAPASESPQPVTPRAAGPVTGPASEPDEKLAPSAPPGPFATDDKGFVNFDARCEGTQTVAAIGRTERSVVVICGDEGGRYQYRGVRLSDAAVLRTAAEDTPTRGFLARNANVIYAVSPAELRVTAGDAVIKEEPMVEYRRK